MKADLAGRSRTRLSLSTVARNVVEGLLSGARCGASQRECGPGWGIPLAPMVRFHNLDVVVR